MATAEVDEAEGVVGKVGEPEQGKTTISHKELLTALNSDNVEVILEGRETLPLSDSSLY